MINLRIFYLFFILVILTSCATHYGNIYQTNHPYIFHSKKPFLSFYLLPLQRNSELKKGLTAVLKNKKSDLFLKQYENEKNIANGEETYFRNHTSILLLDCGTHFQRKRYTFKGGKKYKLECN